MGPPHGKGTDANPAAKGAANPAPKGAAPPPFLAALQADSGTIRLQKRKAPEGSRPPLGTVAQSSRSHAAGKKKSGTSIPAHDTNVPSPHPTGSDSTQSLQQITNPPSGGLTRGMLWDKGLPEEVNLTLRPPRHFAALQPFSNAELKELTAMETYTLKCGSLLRTFCAVKEKAGKVQSDLEALQKTHEESVAKHEADLKLKDEEYSKLKTKAEESSKSYKKLEESYASLKSAHDETKTSLTRQKENYEAQGKKLADAEATIAFLRNQLKVGVECSYNNALAQIQVLNPGVELNMAGMHYKSYVYEGQLVPHPPSPAEESAAVSEAIPMEEGAEAEAV